MRALILPHHGGPDALTYITDFEEPKPATGEVLVKVEAAGVNNVDLVNRAGYPGISFDLPHILGADIAGLVAEVGNGVSDIQAGKRIVVYPLIWCGDCALCGEGKRNLCLNWKFLGLHLKGGYAEYVAVPAQNIIFLPDAISFEEAVSLPVAGLTAYHALKNVGDLKEGETFFIWGGAGGLGTMAIQIAKQLGATVIATAGSETKLNLMKELGADYVFDRHKVDILSEIKTVAPAGVDLVIDYVGPETFPRSFEMLKKGGRMVLFGMMSGRETALSIHMTYLRHLSIIGIYLGTMEEMQALLGWVAERKITPCTGSVFALKDGASAHRLMESGESMGKIVLKV